MNLKDQIAPGGLNYALDDIICGICDTMPGHDLPTIYFELSLMNTFKGDDTIDRGEEQILNLANIWYYDCEKCGKSSTYGGFDDETFSCGGHGYNKLLCGDCHYDHED